MHGNVQRIGDHHGRVSSQTGCATPITEDALKGLGGLDAEEENDRTVVLNEIERVFSEPGPQADTEAWSIFSRQFDHPYDSIY
ncbi:hypothetical protein [Lonsdalea populi]|uniref:hypothetical protein n=1 Tax=Lonsdalea populi TaxID=1172565 RepID=UPI0021AC9D15|nr:hypothetical protein [Lonsdalea populi]